LTGRVRRDRRSAPAPVARSQEPQGRRRAREAGHPARSARGGQLRVPHRRPCRRGSGHLHREQVGRVLRPEEPAH